jgi:hypothetical protein
MVREDKAYAFRKTTFWISTGLSTVMIFVAVIWFFAAVKLNGDSNTARITKVENELRPISEIQFNLKKLCEKFDVQYTEIKE